MTRRVSRGFSLIEMLVVLVVIAILGAMSAAAMYAWTKRASARNAALDIYSALGEARQRALSRGGDVWFIVYPTIQIDGSTGGRGAYFIFDDPDLDFGLTGTPPSGEIRFNTFVPPGNIKPTAGQGSLLREVYLESYQGKSVGFAALSQATKTMKAPFDALNDSGCDFCSGGTPRGAIVFGGEGGARFVAGDGTVLSAKSTMLGLADAVMGKQETFFGVVAPTGFYNIYRP